VIKLSEAGSQEQLVRAINRELRALEAAGGGGGGTVTIPAPTIIYIGSVGAPGFGGVSWNHFDPTEATYSKVGYYRTAEGVVHLVGVATNLNSASRASVPIFTLPTGYRPRKRVRFVHDSNVGAGIQFGISVFEVHTNGDVLWSNTRHPPGTAGVVTYLFLDGCNFPADGFAGTTLDVSGG
jgi:hypothetical protein